MSAQDYQQAAAFCAALGVDPVFDFRAIHDVRKDIPAIPFRGTLEQCWQSIVQYNNQGYGIFAVIAITDGHGQKFENIHGIRAHYIDLDNLSARQNAERAVASNPAPSFGVMSSPEKFHIYWPVEPYADNHRFEMVQRKLRQVFDADRKIIDATRVMRLPGTFHLKNPSMPHMVTCFSIGNTRTDLLTLEAALAHVNVIDASAGGRHELGEPTLAAPSIAWLERALELTDPNDLDRGDWIAVTAAIKQSGWTLTDPDTLMGIWARWCARYTENDPGENLKQWNSLRNTEVGWPYLARKLPQLTVEKYAPVAPGVVSSQIAPHANTEPPPLDCSGEYLTHLEQEYTFKNCVFVVNLGRILTPNMRFLNQNQFNGLHNGKIFIVTSDGKVTKSAWEAAIGGTQYRIPSVDHIRFLPDHPYGEVIIDSLDRRGINIYKPARIIGKQGDPSPFLRHLGFMLPDLNDQKILLDYMAHLIKYPGWKIPWAPVIQSAEGGGKGIIKELMDYCMGDIYTYFPNAQELAATGAKFNAWMRAKLFILVDEVKVDERRNLMETLKTLITERKGEVQAKGQDQDKEDNFTNWFFMTNYKDAVPINRNNRRYAIFFTAFQSLEQIHRMGLDDKYFRELYRWLREDGFAIMYDYFKNTYQIECGDIPMRAPQTSSFEEALQISMGAVERMIYESAQDGIPGFRAGWCSPVAVRKRMTEVGLRAVSMSTIEKIIKEMGYYIIGRSVKPYVEEDHRSRCTLFNLDAGADVSNYGLTQGYI